LQLTFPLGLALDLTGAILIADQASNRLRKLTPAGAISTLAGSSGVFGGDGTVRQLPRRSTGPKEWPSIWLEIF
jgi:hypothetical protein